MKEYNTKELHRHGPCKVMHGSIYGFNGCMIENPAVVFSMNDNDFVIYKYGPRDKLQTYYDNAVQKYLNNGFEDMAKELQILSFSVQTGFIDYDKTTNAKFTVDEICTFINWMNNSIPVKRFQELISSSEEGMHERLAELSELGF